MASSKNGYSVIVRAFDNEPVLLKPLSAKNGLVEVAGADESKSINLRQDTVYLFSPELFEKLRAAYARHDRYSLMQLWDEARPYRPLFAE